VGVVEAAYSRESLRRIVVQTIKTAVVVVLLLGVCYGAFVALNAPDPVLPPEIEGLLPMDIDSGQSVSVDIPQLDKTPSNISALTPPILTSPTFPTADPSLTLEPNPVKLPAFGASKSDSNEFSDLTLPPEIEGSSVPLPAAEKSLAMSDPRLGKMTSIPKLDAPRLEAGNLALPDLAGPAVNAQPDSPLTNENVAIPSGSTLQPPNLSTSVGLISPTTSSSPTTTTTSTNKLTQPFKVTRDEALKLARDGKIRDALAKLSPYYNHIELTREEHIDLVDLLDALAGEVIYSTRHLLEPPFTVKQGETLEAIANRFHVSPETLMNINLMGESKVVLAGSKLKVLNGPFRADVNLNRGELTLFLGELYAGSFSISVGVEPNPIEGTFQIIDRRRDRTYVGANSQILPASDSRNPYGGYWMNLGQDLSIHGSPAIPTPGLENAGCISLAPLDAREVYSLLAQGSQVTIHR
jgi:LysM repeat protein